MSFSILTSLHCLVYTVLAWIGAYAAWGVSRSAATMLALLGCLALVLAVVPFVWQP